MRGQRAGGSVAAAAAGVTFWNLSLWRGSEDAIKTGRLEYEPNAAR